MTDLALAIFATSRPWAGRWARHIRDHGPGEVVDTIAEPSTVYDRSWQVLVADATSILVRREFVTELHQRGRAIIAVWDPDEPSSKEHALAAEVDDLVECNATPAEFLAVATELAARYPLAPQRASRARRRAVGRPVTRKGPLVAVGGPIGANAERVVLGLARAMARKDTTVAVVDANDLAPCIAQLVSLEPYPNLTSASAAAQRSSAIDDHLQSTDRFYVLAGLGDSGQWAEVSPRNVSAVVNDLAGRWDRTLVAVGPVVEPGERFAISRLVLAEADVIVGVCDASPVGIARMTAWVADVRTLAPATPLYLAAANSPGDRFRQGQVLEQLRSLGRPAGVVVLPEDEARHRRAGWNGRAVRRGPLVKSVRSLAEVIVAKGAK